MLKRFGEYIECVRDERRRWWDVWSKCVCVLECDVFVLRDECICCMCCGRVLVTSVGMFLLSVLSVVSLRCFCVA